MSANVACALSPSRNEDLGAVLRMNLLWRDSKESLDGVGVVLTQLQQGGTRQVTVKDRFHARWAVLEKGRPDVWVICLKRNYVDQAVQRVLRHCLENSESPE